MRGLGGEVVPFFVMPGLVPGIHDFPNGRPTRRGWPGERAVTPVFDGLCPAMTHAAYREHSIATKLSQLPAQAFLPLVGTAPVISSRSILRNDFACTKDCDSQ